LRHFIRLLTGKQPGPPPWVDPKVLASDYIYIIFILFLFYFFAIFPTKNLEKKMLQFPSLFSVRKKTPIFILFLNRHLSNITKLRGGVLFPH
jgi:hypothetical protein